MTNEFKDWQEIVNPPKLTNADYSLESDFDSNSNSFPWFDLFYYSTFVVLAAAFVYFLIKTLLSSGGA